MQKTAIVVLSDPKSGGEEALGRLFNAMFLTWELKEKNADVDLIFQGAGARWPAEIVSPAHPANALYRAVQDKVAGVCGGCADVFGASAALKAAGFDLTREAHVPGTTGVIDLSKYLADDTRLLLF